ncbi:cytochrome b5 domain-containing protein [Clostridium folliculivorans]|uniref:cytochrome b5 domain-containing protein n=1 Tax=Clostridium folliculivorans TaxID=2886038 RepID=UPI0021C452C3|nr:cytochrome b5 domain-containing protein [Clostridium folliculivorans]
MRNYQNDLRAPESNKVFTLSELAQYDGTKGNPAYVSVNGIVYDVSSISKWSGGTHYGLTAGKDLTAEFETCHGVPSKLSKLPIVGVLKG